MRNGHSQCMLLHSQFSCCMEFSLHSHSILHSRSIKNRTSHVLYRYVLCVPVRYVLYVLYSTYGTVLYVLYVRYCCWSATFVHSNLCILSSLHSSILVHSQYHSCTISGRIAILTCISFSVNIEFTVRDNDNDNLFNSFTNNLNAKQKEHPHYP